MDDKHQLSDELDGLTLVDSRDTVASELSNYRGLNRSKHSKAEVLVRDYFQEKDSTFQRLCELMDEGWANPKGDEFFKTQRERADNASAASQHRFYKMMVEIAQELEQSTGVLTDRDPPNSNIKILDLCMAPGGYTEAALRHNPGSKAFGITLPAEQGGHRVLIPLSTLSQTRILELDITMLYQEIGGEPIPANHPDQHKFISLRPFALHTFDLVFCDGMVLRSQKRAEYREGHEAARLRYSQLVLAMQRIKEGGTLTILLHALGCWGSVKLLHQFNQFSTIQLFKPQKKHAMRSSFYLIAKNVQPRSKAAIESLASWKKAWLNLTFNSDEKDDEELESHELEEVQIILDQFGSRVIEIGRPIWKTQEEALQKADFVNKTSST